MLDRRHPFFMIINPFINVPCIVMVCDVPYGFPCAPSETPPGTTSLIISLRHPCALSALKALTSFSFSSNRFSSISSTPLFPVSPSGFFFFLAVRANFASSSLNRS